MCPYTRSIVYGQGAGLTDRSFKAKKEESDMENRRSIAGLSLIIFLVMIAWLPGYAQQAGAQQVVYPTNTSADPLNVQTAVNVVPVGGTVLLKATNLGGTPTPFNFGEFLHSFK